MNRPHFPHFSAGPGVRGGRRPPVREQFRPGSPRQQRRPRRDEPHQNHHPKAKASAHPPGWVPLLPRPHHKVATAGARPCSRGASVAAGAGTNREPRPARIEEAAAVVGSGAGAGAWGTGLSLAAAAPPRERRPRGDKRINATAASADLTARLPFPASPIAIRRPPACIGGCCLPLPLTCRARG